MCSYGPIVEPPEWFFYRQQYTNKWARHFSGSALEVINVHAAHFHSWCWAVQKASPRIVQAPWIRDIFLHTSRGSISFRRECGSFVHTATIGSAVQILCHSFNSLCTFAGRCPSILSFSIAVWVCAGCRSPSGPEYSAGCCWDSAEGGRGLSLDEEKKSLFYSAYA